MADKKAEQELSALRTKIDAIDEGIHQAISDRAALAGQVAEVKKAAAEKGEKVVFYRPEREAQVLRHVMDRNNGPLSDEVVARLFREIMSACLSLEEPLKIAYLGPEGTFTQSAAIKHFGHAVSTESLGSIDDVFREVQSGAANYGVVPVENSTEGVVNHTLDSFMTSSARICGEVELRIHHHLMVSEKTRLESISRVYSHQQSLAQCRKWLDAYMPNVERVSVSSNAEAAKRLQGEWNAAAIAGDMAAETYGLKVVHNNIEDHPDNTTRFIIIGLQDIPPSGSDKTSILVSTKNKPGALFRLLKPFEDQSIDLTRVETRPSRTSAWSYVFFIDFEGHRDDEKVGRILHALEQEALEVRCLGSYPRAVL